MRSSFHICCIEMLPKKLMGYGFIISVNVKKLQISLTGNLFTASLFRNDSFPPLPFPVLAWVNFVVPCRVLILEKQSS